MSTLATPPMPRSPFADRLRPITASEYRRMVAAQVFDGETVALRGGRLAVETAPGIWCDRPLSAAEVERLTAARVWQCDDRFELLHGTLVKLMADGPIHAGLGALLLRLLSPAFGTYWWAWVRSTVGLGNHIPIPDLALVRPDSGQYLTRRPGGPDIGLVIEVATTSLAQDRTTIRSIYARAGIPHSWIINTEAKVIEVYAKPSGESYTVQRDYRPGELLPIVLDDLTVAGIAVADVLP